jgi:putative transposase
MTSIWTAEHGWCHLNAIVDCCTREIPAWALDIRCRKQEALAVVEQAVDAQAVEGDQLVLGTDNGTAYTSRGFRARLSELDITHRRSGYRDPESQAFIESWFEMLKRREVWRHDYQTLEDARAGIARYVERYHHRPHQFLGYQTPKEVSKTREDAQEIEPYEKTRPEVSTLEGSRPVDTHVSAGRRPSHPISLEADCVHVHRLRFPQGGTVDA